jgi:hypothetical protein
MDYTATFPNTNIIYAGGTAENILTDKRDIGRFVARIIKDDRTLNQKVVTVGDSLTQNQIWDIVERAGDEKVPKTHVSYSLLNLSSLATSLTVHRFPPKRWFPSSRPRKLKPRRRGRRGSTPQLQCKVIATVSL